MKFESMGNAGRDEKVKDPEKARKMAEAGNLERVSQNYAVKKGPGHEDFEEFVGRMARQKEELTGAVHDLESLINIQSSDELLSDETLKAIVDAIERAKQEHSSN